jgi:subfamily B ATP-binding cassette protein HlyB/CyaB
MQDLFAVQYSWLIPLLPLIGAGIAGLLGARWLKGRSHWPIWIGVGASMVISFMLQLFGLVSPLFFQVVMDKVLVHKGMTTWTSWCRPGGGLDLRGGAVDPAQLRLRPHHQPHRCRTRRAPVPAPGFAAAGLLPGRRVGDSVARVRELENIRNFLTSSALTLVIDLFFTFVFLAVMFLYSPLLTWIVLGSFPFYIAISMGVTPLFRQRLAEKFQRGAENQAFLVESVTGIETLKAMAVEPQMQRRWEEQLAVTWPRAFAS